MEVCIGRAKNRRVPSPKLLEDLMLLMGCELLLMSILLQHSKMLLLLIKYFNLSYEMSIYRLRLRLDRPNLLSWLQDAVYAMPWGVGHSTLYVSVSNSM